MNEEEWEESDFRGAHVAEILSDPKLKQTWATCLAAQEDLSAKQKAACLAFIENVRDSFLRLIADVEDPKEQSGLVAVYYANLTAQWILINTHAGYRAQSDQVDMILLCKAGLISATIGALEPALCGQNADCIRQFFSDLVQSGEFGSLGDDKLWVRNISLAALHAEHMSLRAELQRIFAEVGVDSIESTIQSWRANRDELGRASAQSAQAQSYIAAFVLEFGENVFPKDVIQKVRALNDEVSQLAGEREAAKHSWQRMGRELGVSNPEQVTQMVRELRDRINQLTHMNASSGSDLELLHREIGSQPIGEIIREINGLRDYREQAIQEIELLRGEQQLLLQEFGKSDAASIIEQIEAYREHASDLDRRVAIARIEQERLIAELGIEDAQEIVPRIRSLKAHGNAFSELSSLLGNMDHAITTLSA